MSLGAFLIVLFAVLYGEMDTQNQNQPQSPPPNFDFIMNQPGPDGTQPHGQKKFSKKVVLLSVMVIFTVIMGGVLILVPPPTDEVVNNNNASNDLPVTVADTFLQNLRDAKPYTDNKSNMTTSLQSVIIDENMYNYTMRRITDSVDVTTCQKVNNSETGSEYDCTKKADEQTAKLFITTANDTDGATRISGIKVGTVQ